MNHINREKEMGAEPIINIDGHRIDVSVSSAGITGIRLPGVPLPESHSRGKRNNDSGMLELNSRSKLKVPEICFLKSLEEYLCSVFRGKRPSSMPLISLRTVGFEAEVLLATSRIPWGETRTYSWVAEAAGRPGAARAVGNALGRNPIPILIPCHRVVRSDGSLGGFSSGLWWKKKLLSLESSTL